MVAGAREEWLLTAKMVDVRRRTQLALGLMASGGGMIAGSWHGLVDLVRGRLGNLHETYDPEVAILMLTYVSLVWYTFFTYQAVAQRPLPSLRPELLMNGDFELVFLISNGEGGAAVQLQQSVWARVDDGTEAWIPADLSYRTKSEDRPVLILADGMKTARRYGLRNLDGRHLHIVWAIRWIDVHGRKGRMNLRFFEVDLRRGGVEEVLSRTRIDALFARLPDPLVTFCEEFSK